MKRVIEKTKKHSTVLILAALLLGAGVTAVSLYAESAEAVVQQSVGIIGGEVSARAAIGWEYVNISYAGTGVMDMSGWSIYADDEEVFTFYDFALVSGSSVRVCEDMDAQRLDCPMQWSGGEKFDDTAGVMALKDEHGEIVFSIDYQVLDESTRMPIKGQLDGSYVVDVLRQNDKVQLCHDDARKGMVSKKVTSGTFMSKYLAGRSGHHEDVTDMIPPFFYDTKGTVGYYSGMNYKGNETFVENGCV